MVTIVKVGGAVLESEKMTNDFLDAFLKIEGAKILVHGGGREATYLAKKLGVKSSFINGRRVTSPQLMDVLIMSYTSQNKILTSKIQYRGSKAIGLNGADLGLINSKRRNVEPINFGMVGEPIGLLEDIDIFNYFFRNEIIPVFSALTFEKETGEILNTNADAIALFLAKSLRKLDEVKLLYAFEFDGVLLSLDDKNSLIETLSKKEYKELVTKKIVHSGMLPKLDSAFSALEAEVKQVEIVSYKKLNNGTRFLLE